jgi:hypothetical protein
MSRTTTASTTDPAVRMASKTARSPTVHGNPSTMTISSGGNGSWRRCTSGAPRMWPAPPRARGTGRRVRPSGATPSTYVAPCRCSAAQPVSAPPEGSRIACSAARCPGKEASTSAGTRKPRLLCRQPGPRAWPRVGPLTPVGSTGTGRTIAGRAGSRRWAMRALCREASMAAVGHAQAPATGAGVRWAGAVQGPRRTVGTIFARMACAACDAATEGGSAAAPGLARERGGGGAGQGWIA